MQTHTGTQPLLTLACKHKISRNGFLFTKTKSLSYVQFLANKM